MKTTHSNSTAALAALLLCAGTIAAAPDQSTPTPYGPVAATPDQIHSSGSANRDPASPVASADDSTLAYSDRRFVKRAAELGAEEVAISQFVSRAATDPRVHQFATEMVSAHEKVNGELAGLASRKGVTLAHENESLSRWTKKDPKSLAADFVSEMESAHEKLINLFEKAARSDDADVSAFASKYLPDLRRHYTMARELKKALNG